jgi:hypothetical protein
VKAEEVEVGSIELQLAERPTGEEQIGEGGPSPGHCRFEALDDVTGQGKSPLLQPGSAGQGIGPLLVQGGQIAGALGAEEESGPGSALRGRPSRSGVGLPVVEKGEGEAQPDEEALVLVAGDRELVEHVAGAHRGIGNPAPPSERETGAGRCLLRFQRAEVWPGIDGGRSGRGPQTRSQIGAGRLRRSEGPTDEACCLRAQQQGGREFLLLLPQVGQELLRLQLGPIDIEPGDVPAALPLALQQGQTLGIGDGFLHRRDPELGGGHLGDSLQEIQPALAEQLDQIQCGGLSGRLTRRLTGAALSQLHQLAQGEGVVGNIGQFVQAGGIGRAEGNRSPLEVEGGVGEQLRSGDVGGGQAQPGARGHQVRAVLPDDLSQLRLGRKPGEIESRRLRSGSQERGECGESEGSEHQTHPQQQAACQGQALGGRAPAPPRFESLASSMQPSFILPGAAQGTDRAGGARCARVGGGAAVTPGGASSETPSGDAPIPFGPSASTVRADPRRRRADGAPGRWPASGPQPSVP